MSSAGECGSCSHRSQCRPITGLQLRHGAKIGGQETQLRAEFQQARALWTRAYDELAADEGKTEPSADPQVQYQLSGRSDEELKAIRDYLAGEPVALVSGNEFLKEQEPLENRVMAYLT